jgi:predicted MPP superfamily phosphohydrolase
MKSDSTAQRSALRISLFLLVFSTVMLSATWFVCATWNHFEKLPGLPRWELIFPGLTMGFIVMTILGRVHSSLALRVVYRICAVWLGVLNYCFFAAIMAWIFYGAAALPSFHIEPALMAGVFFGAGVTVSAYGLVNAAWLRVTRIEVKLANLPACWRGRCVALVTDMHLGNVRGAGFARRIAAKIQQLKADAVFLSGDMFDGTKADLDALVEPWKQISAGTKIYFVTGNHEEFTNRAPYLEAARRVGIRVLDNEKVELDEMQIAGIHDAELHDPQVFRALLRGLKLDRNRPVILLAHQPVNLEIAQEEGVTLQVCGHTHGGQIWPWTRVAARVHGRFSQGLNQLASMQVLTSNGTGTWGMPMRVGTKSEIVLIQLEASPST